MPIRWRLTLAFTLVMATVLAGVGLFVHARLRSELDQTIDQGLRSRADDVSAVGRRTATGLPQAGRSSLVERGESFAQVLDARGRIVASTPQLGSRRALSARDVRRARARTIFVERGPIGGVDERSRLLATPVRSASGEVIVVVGSALDDRDDALRELRRVLLVGLPVALLLAALAGYGLAAAALRPVEAMRRRAALVVAEGRGQGLPVPSAHDELRRLGETLNAMIARLEAAFERERAFVADAGHELRTPLAILRAELDLALREGRSEADLRDALRSASEETERLTQLAEDLLVIAHSDQGRLPVRFAPVALEEVLERVRRRFEARAEAAGRPLGIEAAPGLVVSADPLRLEQALGNLVDNALRHGSGAITIRCREAAGQIELHVLDRGPGFPASFADRAFERFTRAEGTRGGAGLGLAIVDAIARAHGGAAHAGARPDGGADVWIAIPLSPEVHVPRLQTGDSSESKGAPR